MPIKRVTCTGPCGRTLPHTNKYFRMQNGRRMVRCRECENEEARERRDQKRRDRSKDWAWSYRSKLTKQLRGENTSVQAVDLPAATLRAIMNLQKGQCALTGYTLHRPPLKEARAGWEIWRKTLSDEDKNYTPVLVRVVKSAGWTVGNVIFIAAMLCETYEAAGGLKGFLELTRRCHRNPVRVPTPGDIGKTRIEDLKRKYE